MSREEDAGPGDTAAIGRHPPAARGKEPIRDPRNAVNGLPLPMPSGCLYADQPYVVRLDGGAWLCLMTVGTIGEVKGSENYAVAFVSRDRGRTWSDPVRCQSTYPVPLKSRSGRIFALRPSDYAWSDDGGATWSEPLPTRTPDGDIGWNVGMPLVVGEQVWIPWAEWKGGRDTVVHFNHSPNLLTEGDPEKVRFEQVATLKGPGWDRGGRVSEEPHLAALRDGTFYCVFRTDQGHIAFSTSRDRGRSWSESRILTYADGRRPIRNPRACPSLWTCSNGKHLLWHHNHGGTDYSERNPAWLSGGIERDGGILWSEPEPVLYLDDLGYHHGRLSYPGFLEEDGRYRIFETSKTRAGMHEVGADFLEALWGQFGDGRVSRDGLAVELGPGELDGNPVFEMEKLPDLRLGMGFAADLWVELGDRAPGRVLLDNRREDGVGILLETAGGGALRLEMSDGRVVSSWTSDPGRIPAGAMCHIVITVDGGPKTLCFVTDGRIHDGGAARRFGWGRFHPAMGEVSGAGRIRIAPCLNGSVRRFRFYTRRLTISEAVAHWKAGPADRA